MSSRVVRAIVFLLIAAASFIGGMITTAYMLREPFEAFDKAHAQSLSLYLGLVNDLERGDVEYVAEILEGKAWNVMTSLRLKKEREGIVPSADVIGAVQYICIRLKAQRASLDEAI